MLTTNTKQDQKVPSLGQYDPVDDYLNHLVETVQRIPREQIWEVVRVLYRAWQQGKCIFIFGNGGSAATASHMVNDLSKLTIVSGKPRLKVFGLNDNVPLMTAWGNDTEYANIYAEQLANLVAPGDVVIGISTSGNSANILRAMAVAHQQSAICVGLTGNDGGKLKDMVDYCIFIPDEHHGRQEDGHMILDHIIAIALRWMITGGGEQS